MSIQFQFKKALELIQQSGRVFLTTHEGTDGDDLGSALAMLEFLKQSGKEVEIAIKGGVPGNLSFLPNHELVRESPTTHEFDLAIVFGCRDLDRTGLKVLKQFTCPFINFDHHPDSTNYGKVNIVDETRSSVAELVYYFLEFAEADINKNIATPLLTGIFTDTGGFKHANTTADALQAAANLLKKGARIDKIAVQTMGRKRPQAIQAWAKGLENARFDPEKKMVFSVLTEDDLKQIGASDEDLDGFVELLNNLPQAKFALLLRQDGEVVKGSLRSEPHKKMDVSKIAQAFGGGGHKLASGFKIKGRLVKEEGAWRIE